MKLPMLLYRRHDRPAVFRDRYDILQRTYKRNWESSSVRDDNEIWQSMPEEDILAAIELEAERYGK